MAATVTNTLDPASLPAEKAMFGLPVFTCIHTATATTLLAVVTGKANQQIWLKHFTLSFSGAPSGPLTLQVKDGITVIWQTEIGVSVLIYTENFETAPLHASVGANMSVGIASAGGTTVQTISWSGFFGAAP